MSTYELSSSVRAERLGDEWVVLDAAGGMAHRLFGHAAAALTSIVAGGDVDSVDPDAVDALLEAGIIVPTAPVNGLSRRRLVGVGSVVGLVTLALPGAAAGASGVTSSPSEPTVTYLGVASPYDIEVRWPWPGLSNDSVARWRADVAFTDDPNVFAAFTNVKHNPEQLGVGEPLIRFPGTSTTRTYRAKLYLAGATSPAYTLDIPATKP